VVGIHQHRFPDHGSAFVDSLEKTVALVRKLRARGMDIRYLDVGGGLGITYRDEEPPLPADFARALMGVVRDLDTILILEPGRVLVGNAGILVTRVLYTKQSPAKRFVVVDAGMNDLARPSLYGSYHGIQPVRREAGRPQVTVDVVGPICESGDFLAKDRMLPRCEPGELLAVLSAGRTGWRVLQQCATTAPEVMVRGDDFHVVRARETFEDLVRGERTLDELG
jgi:diaminopimelate decarboxylase